MLERVTSGERKTKYEMKWKILKLYFDWYIMDLVQGGFYRGSGFTDILCTKQKSEIYTIQTFSVPPIAKNQNSRPACYTLHSSRYELSSCAHLSYL